MKNCLFTSESVTSGHPDKVCDQISDAVLDEYLQHDRDSRVACECFAGENFLVIGGEVTSKHRFAVDALARSVIKNIGYTEKDCGFKWDDIDILVKLNTQSPDIALGVDTGGAGDQGIMFGYACKDTARYMPAPIYYAHALAMSLENIRKHQYSDILGPDGKTQVTIKYGSNNNIEGIDTILVSTQHRHDVTIDDIRDIIVNSVIPMAIHKKLIKTDTKILVNPTGRFVIGGPKGDTGLTGRKIIVDSYGGFSRHGGGCWSGKDPTKVDRSAAYMARYIAKNVIAAADRSNPNIYGCEIQLAYAIGVKEPVSVYVNIETISNISNIHKRSIEKKIAAAIRSNFDLTPSGIIDKLHLKDVRYEKLAAYGHIGRSSNIAPWENIDSMDAFDFI